VRNQELQGLEGADIAVCPDVTLQYANTPCRSIIHLHKAMLTPNAKLSTRRLTRIAALGGSEGRAGSPVLLSTTPAKRIISEEETAVIAAPERGPGEWVVEPSTALTSTSYTKAGPVENEAAVVCQMLLACVRIKRMPCTNRRCSGCMLSLWLSQGEIKSAGLDDAHIYLDTSTPADGRMQNTACCPASSNCICGDMIRELNSQARS
jgi:hypothetical protein